MGLEDEYKKSTRGLAILFGIALALLLLAVVWRSRTADETSSASGRAQLATTIT